MLLMGDEVRRTQGGNNNAYCAQRRDQLVRLVRAVERHADILRFTKGLIADAPPAGDAARRARGDQSPGHPRQRVARVERRDRRPARLRGVVAQHGAHAAGRAGRPAPHLQRVLGAARLRAAAARGAGSTGWRRIVDTSLDAPADLATHLHRGRGRRDTVYRAEARSIAIVARAASRAAARRKEGAR